VLPRCLRCTPVTSEPESAGASAIILPLKTASKPLPDVLTDSASLAKLLVEDKLLPMASALVTQVKRRVHAKPAIMTGVEPHSSDNTHFSDDVSVDNSTSNPEHSKYNLEHSKPNKEA